MAKPPFSIIVCAHNEHKNLKKLLPRLLAQHYPDFEIIVILDRCGDGSSGYLEKLTSPKLRVIEIGQVPYNWNPKKFGLSAGIKEARNDWLLFTDADCVPRSVSWVDTFSRHCGPGTEIILGIGAFKKEKHLIGQITAYETFQTAFQYVSSALRGSPYMGVGRNIAYRKSTFLKKGGFSSIQEITGGDDDLLVQKMATSNNTKVNWHQKSLTCSRPERTWKGYFGQKTRHFSVGGHYSLKYQFEHLVRTAAHALAWLIFLSLPIFSGARIGFMAIFIVILVVKGIIFKKISAKIGLSFRLSTYPVLDLIYAVFLPLLGIRANVTKNIRWK